MNVFIENVNVIARTEVQLFAKLSNSINLEVEVVVRPRGNLRSARNRVDKKMIAEAQDVLARAVEVETLRCNTIESTGEPTSSSTKFSV